MKLLEYTLLLLIVGCATCPPYSPGEWNSTDTLTNTDSCEIICNNGTDAYYYCNTEV